MSDQTLTRRGEATRARLLEAAMAELVERDGALEVASVAARADVSVGLLYRYFGSKAGLVAAVVADFYDRLMTEIARGRTTAARTGRPASAGARSGRSPSTTASPLRRSS